MYIPNMSDIFLLCSTVLFTWIIIFINIPEENIHRFSLIRGLVVFVCMFGILWIFRFVYRGLQLPPRLEYCQWDPITTHLQSNLKRTVSKCESLEDQLLSMKQSMKDLEMKNIDTETKLKEEIGVLRKKLNGGRQKKSKIRRRP